MGCANEMLITRYLFMIIITVAGLSFTPPVLDPCLLSCSCISLGAVSFARERHWKNKALCAQSCPTTQKQGKVMAKISSGHSTELSPQCSWGSAWYRLS